MHGAQQSALNRHKAGAAGTPEQGCTRQNKNATGQSDSQSRRRCRARHTSYQRQQITQVELRGERCSMTRCAHNTEHVHTAHEREECGDRRAHIDHAVAAIDGKSGARALVCRKPIISCREGSACLLGFAVAVSARSGPYTIAPGPCLPHQLHRFNCEPHTHSEHGGSARALLTAGWNCPATHTHEQSAQRNPGRATYKCRRPGTKSCCSSRMPFVAGRSPRSLGTTRRWAACEDRAVQPRSNIEHS